MPSLSRRELLKRSALLSLAPAVPAFLARAARAAPPEKDRRVLVVVQLDGGNDGLNTVVPRKDENYARLRPKLALKEDRLIRLNDSLALHPAMAKAGKLFDDGRLAIVQGVGYPNPDRSHFRSMAIWQSARLDEADHGQYGWLGRALDRGADRAAEPCAVYAGAGTTPVSLWGRRAAVASIPSLDEVATSAPAAALRGVQALPDDGPETLRQVARASDAAFVTAERLTAVAAAPGDAGRTYGNSQLAEQLKVVSALIKSDCPARVYYTAQAGYDTHAVQADDHYRLLRNLSDAVAGFLDDLTAAQVADRVAVLCFSEFGRRAAENDSAGTDHGAAGPILLAGANVAAGIVGPNPDLANLDDGDVRMALDFRQVYAAILDKWL